jgi:chromosomal replication initiation ATPase DnaA
MTAPRQLTLDLAQDPSFAAEDFLRAPANRAAFDAIELWPRWTSRMLLLTGPSGSGKSHLGAIWGAAAKAEKLPGDALDETALAIARTASALLIEDVDRVGAAETALFHLLNVVAQRDVWLLMTARAAPDAWALRTPDLLSRLRLAPIAALSAPDQQLTEAVLFKLFSDRQLLVDPQVVAYIALRVERSLGAARDIVAALDREALSRGRRVTRAMAGQILGAIGEWDESP